MSDAAAPTPAATSVQTRLLAVAALAIFAINLRLWGFETPPLIDWPNHLARHILQCGALSADAISRYYLYDLQIVPNLTSELVHTLPAACADPALTQKVLIQVSSFGLFAAALVLHRAIWREWSLWPLLAALLMHNMAWAYGFENYALATPVALLALAVWFTFERSGPLLRLGAVWPLAVGLYVLHLYAFGFLMMALGLLELQRLWDTRQKAGLLKAAASSAAMLGLIALWPAVHFLSALAASPEIQMNDLNFGGVRTLLTTILSPVAGFGNVVDSSETILVSAAALAILLAAPVVCRFAGLPVEFDNRLRLAAPIMLAITLLVPDKFSGVYYTNIRFPVLLAAVLIAATRVEFGMRSAGMFAIVVVMAVFAKTEWIASKWQVHDAQVAELRAAAQVLSAEDRLLVLREHDGHVVKAHSHSASYVLRDRGVYWTGLFTGGNALSPRPEYAARDHTQAFPLPWQALGPRYRELSVFAEGNYLHRWQDFYTHGLLFFDPAAPRPDPSDVGTTVVRGTFFEILLLDTSAARAQSDSIDTAE